MALSLRYSAVSDIGRSRKKNDDSGYAGPHFIMVADGMGGAAAGDLASAVAVQTMRRLDAPIRPATCSRRSPGPSTAPTTGSPSSSRKTPRVEGMGTTVDAVLFDGTQIGVAHLGDSRGYLWRDGELLADHPRPHLGAEPDRRRAHHRGRGEGPLAPLAAAQGARRPARQRPRPDACTTSRPATGS